MLYIVKLLWFFLISMLMVQVQKLKVTMILLFLVFQILHSALYLLHSLSAETVLL